MSTAKSLFLTYLALMLLLMLTVGLSFLPLGGWGIFLCYVIATLKMILIGAIFMKLRESSPSLRLFALGGILWFIILFAITWGDYLTRGQAGLPGK